MDFALSPEIEDYRRRVRAFVEEHIIPVEADPAAYDAHENIREDRLAGLRQKARAQGLWALQMPKALGGQGLPVTVMAACYEEMGRSIFGAVTFNCAAPDDGNMILLEKVGRPDQQEKWLKPIIEGKADFVLGSRFMGFYEEAGSVRHIGVVFFSRMISLLPARIRLILALVYMREIGYSSI